MPLAHATWPFSRLDDPACSSYVGWTCNHEIRRGARMACLWLGTLVADEQSFVICLDRQMHFYSAQAVDP